MILLFFSDVKHSTPFEKWRMIFFFVMSLLKCFDFLDKHIATSSYELHIHFLAINFILRFFLPYTLCVWCYYVSWFEMKKIVWLDNISSKIHFSRQMESIEKMINLLSCSRQKKLRHLNFRDKNLRIFDNT